MTKGKKYDYRVVQDQTGWSVEIVRRVTSRKNVVSKKQAGFASESDAQAWGEKELKVFSQSLKQQSQRRSDQHSAGSQPSK